MASPRAALLALVATLLLGSSAGAVPAKRRKAAAPPSLPSNLPPERPPPPSAIPRAGSGPGATATAPEASTSLIPGVSNTVALAAGGGLALLLLVLLVAARRRPSARTLAPQPQRPQRPARQEHADRTEPPATRPAARKRKATHLVTSREAGPPAVEVSPAQSVLLARSDGTPSLHETLVALGPDLVALRCLRQAAREHLDALAWASTVKDRQAHRLDRLTAVWGRQLALQRVVAWLSDHPLVKESGLAVQVPGTLDAADLANLTLTQPDGLGVTLNPEQSALLKYARASLGRAFGDRPLALLAASSGLSALLPKELQAEVQQGHPAHALPLLLGGLRALDWAAQAGLSRPGMGGELREALREHTKLVGTPVTAEGSVAHALEVLGGGRLEGIGLLLAAVAGAAFSSSTVVLRVSKRIGEIIDSSLLGAFSRLGALACAALDDESSPDHPTLLENIHFLLGEPLLERETRRAAALLKEVERLASREPLWKGAALGDLPAPDLALIQLHGMQVERSAAHAAQAHERMVDLLDRLAHPGGVNEETIGHRRLGYVLAGLGAPMLRNTSTELLSAGREAMALTTGPDEAPPPPPRPR